MRRAALLAPAVLAAATVLAEGGALGGIEAEQAALYRRVAAGVALVGAPGKSGAGFAVAPGLLVTAAHVVAGEGTVDVALRDGAVVRGTVVERAEGGVDLALVRIPAAPPALELGSSAALAPGSVVAAMGHDDGSRFVFAVGLVAQAEEDAVDGSLLRLQVPLRAGASGGPVVDRDGRVVGIVTLGAPGTAAFAVRIEAALRALPGLAGVAVAAAPAAVEPEAPAAEEREPVRAPELVGPLYPTLSPSRASPLSPAGGVGKGEGARARVRAPVLVEEAPPPRPAPLFRLDSPPPRGERGIPAFAGFALGVALLALAVLLALVAARRASRRALPPARAAARSARLARRRRLGAALSSPSVPRRSR